MTQKIRTQAAKFWSVLAGSETLATYQKAIDVTWQILREGALLIWLVLCLVLVGFDWGSERAIATGRASRRWLNSLEPQDSNQLATDMAQKLLATSKSSAAKAVSQARQQLGLPAKPEALASPSADSPMKSAAPPDETNPEPDSTTAAKPATSGSDAAAASSAPASAPASSASTDPQPSGD